ncbi:hypothetical protein M0805_000664 [Coniferiporia weirii]|nr:hypothetical protein M0805_000664 [Coniferiporia weirii]
MIGLKSQALRELKVPDAAPKYKNVEPTAVEAVASYNWIEETTPTILVLGCPPIWQDRQPPFRVPRDTEKSFVDQNRHRVPKYPLLPLVTAIDHLDPGFDFAAIDVVSDRNNLRKLMRWVDGSIARDFRIDLQLAGAATVLFTRCDFQPVELDSSRFGYGRNFEARTTKPLEGCEDSTGHHRVITYINVRRTQTSHITKRVEQRPPTRKNDPDDLLSAFEKLTIKADDKIDIIPAGVLAPQSKLVEMTTRSVRSMEEGFDWQDFFPQLFLSQTPNSFIGIHERGQFRRIEAGTLGDTILSKQRRTQQAAFDRFRVLLEDVRQIAVNAGKDARLSLIYRVETKKLEVFERDSDAGSLPDSWMGRFEVRTPETKAEIGKDTTETKTEVKEEKTEEI